MLAAPQHLLGVTSECEPMTISWPYFFGGVILIAVALEFAPKWGGWLLLLVVVGLFLFNRKAQQLITANKP